jgi:Predicted transcriptional regulator
MALCYNRLWKLLIDRGMTRTQMRLAAGISTSTLAKLSKGEDVNTSILVKICDALGCGIRDIVDSVPREPRRKNLGKNSAKIELTSKSSNSPCTRHCGT